MEGKPCYGDKWNEVRYVGHSDAAYSDILSDYTANTEGQTSGTLDEWD